MINGMYDVGFRELPPGIVGVPFFEKEEWWYFAAYVRNTGGGAWQRLYARGPMLLTSSAAENEFVDTVEAFWGRSVFMWKWLNGQWVPWRQIL